MNRLRHEKPDSRLQDTVPVDRTDDDAKRNGRFAFLHGNASKRLLALNCVLATVYFLVLAFGFQPGNHLLFYLLIAGEVFHLIQIFGFSYTIWETKHSSAFEASFDEPVDVFITVCGEPMDIPRDCKGCTRHGVS